MGGGGNSLRTGVGYIVSAALSIVCYLNIGVDVLCVLLIRVFRSTIMLNRGIDMLTTYVPLLPPLSVIVITIIAAVTHNGIRRLRVICGSSTPADECQWCYDYGGGHS